MTRSQRVLPAQRGGSELALRVDEVRQAMLDHLTAEGYQVSAVVGGSGGADLEAWRDGFRLLVDIPVAAAPEGEPADQFAGVLGALVQQMRDATAQYGLVLPDSPPYRELVDALPYVARDRLRLRIWFVRREGTGLAVVEDHGVK